MLRVIIIVGILVLGLESRCQAYIDPTAGGFLFQILAPLGALAASFFIYFGNRILGLFRKPQEQAQSVDAESMEPGGRQ